MANLVHAQLRWARADERGMGELRNRIVVLLEWERGEPAGEPLLKCPAKTATPAPSDTKPIVATPRTIVRARKPAPVRR